MLARLPGKSVLHYFLFVKQASTSTRKTKEKIKAHLLPLPGKRDLEAHKIVFPASVAGPPLHYHKSNILVKIYSGKVTVRTPRGVVPLQPGDFFFTPAFCPHTEIYDGIETTVGILKIPDVIFPKRPKKPTALYVPPFLKDLYEEILQWGEQNRPYSSEQKSVIKVLADQLAKCREVRHFSIIFPKSGPMLTIAKQVLRNPKSSNNLDTWASRANMSRRSFSKAFREATGMSFTQWCLKLKIAVAIKRILDEDDSKNIAYDLGFSQPSHFISEFKAQTRVTPGKFMENRELWHLSIGLSSNEKTQDSKISWIDGDKLYSGNISVR